MRVNLAITIHRFTHAFEDELIHDRARPENKGAAIVATNRITFVSIVRSIVDFPRRMQAV